MLPPKTLLLLRRLRPYRAHHRLALSSASFLRWSAGEAVPTTGEICSCTFCFLSPAYGQTAPSLPSLLLQCLSSSSPYPPIDCLTCHGRCGGDASWLDGTSVAVSPLAVSAAGHPRDLCLLLPEGEHLRLEQLLEASPQPRHLSRPPSHCQAQARRRCPCPYPCLHVLPGRHLACRRYSLPR